MMPPLMTATPQTTQAGLHRTRRLRQLLHMLRRRDGGQSSVSLSASTPFKPQTGRPRPPVTGFIPTPSSGQTLSSIAAEVSQCPFYVAINAPIQPRPQSPAPGTIVFRYSDVNRHGDGFTRRPPRQVPDRCIRPNYTVESGERFYRISKKLYGSSKRLMPSMI